MLDFDYATLCSFSVLYCCVSKRKVSEDDVGEYVGSSKQREWIVMQEVGITGLLYLAMNDSHKICFKNIYRVLNWILFRRSLLQKSETCRLSSAVNLTGCSLWPM